MLEDKIYHGLVLRIILTLIFYLFLKKMEHVPIINKYLYLILFIFLLFLDCLDNLCYYNIDFLIDVKNILTKKKLGTNISYQKYDKVIDIFSYLLLFIFEIDNYLKFLILYRLIGVILYIQTHNGKALIIFFDFVKEYLLYISIFGNNYKYLLIFILKKIILEYYFFYSKIVNNKFLN